MHGRCADRSLAVHPVPSENIPGRPLVVGLGQELQQHQTIYVLIDTGARLDSGGNSFVSLADSDSNFAVAEQVIDPKGTVTFRIGESWYHDDPCGFVPCVRAACEGECLFDWPRPLTD